MRHSGILLVALALCVGRTEGATAQTSSPAQRTRITAAPTYRENLRSWSLRIAIPEGLRVKKDMEFSVCFPKIEGSLLAGKQDEKYREAGLNRDVTDYIYGAEASVTGRFAWKTSESSTRSVEIGGKSRYTSSDSVFGGISWGYFGRVALQFSY